MSYNIIDLYKPEIVEMVVEFFNDHWSYAISKQEKEMSFGITSSWYNSRDRQIVKLLIEAGAFKKKDGCYVLDITNDYAIMLIGLLFL